MKYLLVAIMTYSLIACNKKENFVQCVEYAESAAWAIIHEDEGLDSMSLAMGKMNEEEMGVYLEKFADIHTRFEAKVKTYALDKCACQE
jgi:hypothetical protein